MDLERGMVSHEGDGTTAAFRPESWSIWRKLDPISKIDLCQQEFRIWRRVATASSPTGGVPPDPLGGRAAPRIPPAKARYWCTAKPTGVVPFLAGADKFSGHLTRRLVASTGWV
jgi:hypothetical protein